MARSSNPWNNTAPNPHKHTLPARVSFSDPMNDRRCVPHRGNLPVKCRFAGCDYTFGAKCTKCKRVV